MSNDTTFDRQLAEMNSEMGILRRRRKTLLNTIERYDIDKQEDLAFELYTVIRRMKQINDQRIDMLRKEANV